VLKQWEAPLTWGQKVNKTIDAGLHHDIYGPLDETL
jgi:hypothetical protein